MPTHSSFNSKSFLHTYNISSEMSYVIWHPTPITGLSPNSLNSNSGNCLNRLDGKYLLNHHFIPLLDIAFIL